MIGFYTLETVHSITNTLQIVRGFNGKAQSCTFYTYDEIFEFDELIIEDEYGTRLFSGIVEKPTIDKKNNLTIRQISVNGYKRIFDRNKINTSYANQTLGYIVRDVLTYCPGFSAGTIAEGPTITKVVFNYEAPSDALRKICDKLGYTLELTFDRTVNVYANFSKPAAQLIDEETLNRQGLKFTPDVSNYVNSVILRGGNYVSSTQTFSTKGNGALRQFILPEKPVSVVVKVNGVSKTVAAKNGDAIATTEFQFNKEEKYVENGTYATLASTDTLTVEYTYEVPLRVRRDNLTAIAAMRQLFPETDGVFQRVINDTSITSRDVADQRCRQELDAYSNPVIDGQFVTRENVFNPGETITIDVNEYFGQAMIQTVTSRHIAGPLWEHTVKFSTVLFDFEDFMRKLLGATVTDINDSEAVEKIYDLDDEASISETLSINASFTRREDAATIADSNYGEKNASITYVLGPYFPSSFADPYRQFCLDGGLLS